MRWRDKGRKERKKGIKLGTGEEGRGWECEMKGIFERKGISEKGEAKKREEKGTREK